MRAVSSSWRLDSGDRGRDSQDGLAGPRGTMGRMATAPAPCPQGHDSIDDVIALYRRDVDVSLLRSRLRLTPEERLRDVMRMQAAVEAMRGAAGPGKRDDGR